MKNQIKLDDNVQEIIIKMAQGNIGALNVLINLIKNEENIDPDNVFVGVGTILSLDQMGIYGPNIWVLYKDVCKQNLTNLVAIFRANQLGLVDEREIVDSSLERNSAFLDVEDILKRVQEILPDFGKTA